jgi:hypothetical protein
MASVQQCYKLQRSYLLEPKVFGQTEEFSHVDGLTESVQIQTILLGYVANRSGLSNFLVVDSSENPVEYTGVFSETRPEKLTLEKRSESS